MNFATRTFGRRRSRRVASADLPPAVTGAARVEALCLPVRLAALDQVRQQGPATATEVGAAIGITPAAASYHLRVLADHGFVAETGDDPDRRKRRWRAVTTQMTVDPTTAATADEALALDRLEAAYFERASGMFASYVERRHEYPDSWRRAASSVQDRLILTPAELSRLRADLITLLARYRRKHPAPAGDATNVFVAFNAVPLDPPPGPRRRTARSSKPQPTAKEA